MHRELLIRLLLTAAIASGCFSARQSSAQEKAAEKSNDAQVKAEKTRDEEVKDLKLSVPVSWIKKPVSGFRVAQFEIPATEGDTEAGEVVVFHFGPNGGGGVQANVERWKNQFDEAGRKMTILDGTSNQGEYVLVDLTGTWNKPIGPPIAMRTAKMPKARFLGVILKSADHGDYFIRLTGQEKTVRENAKALRVAIGAKIDAEKERQSAEKQENK